MPAWPGTAAEFWRLAMIPRRSAGISACTVVFRYSASRTVILMRLSLLPLHQDPWFLIPGLSGMMILAGRLGGWFRRGLLYGKTGCRRLSTGMPTGSPLSLTSGSQTRDAVRRVQGKRDVRASPVPYYEPFSCPGSEQAFQQLPGKLPLGLHRELRVSRCPGRAAPYQRYGQPPGLDPGKPRDGRYREHPRPHHPRECRAAPDSGQPAGNRALLFTYRGGCCL